MAFLKANNKYSASLVADYTVGDSTLSVNSLPTNFPTLITVARNTAKETRFIVTDGSGGILTGVSRFDGANENISAGVSVECMNDAEYINQLSSAVFNQVNLKGLLYAVDGGSTDAYAITLPVTPGSYDDIIGIPIGFKANTANVGPATLNINSLGAKQIRKNSNQVLADGDIQQGQVTTVIYDGSNFQAQLVNNNINAPQGFLINGKIETAVNANNLTISLKGLDGQDPSLSNPLYIRIAGSVRTITSPLSLTMNAGTNWLGLGSDVMAGKEVDLFVYLKWNDIDKISLGVSRIPYGRILADFKKTDGSFASANTDTKRIFLSLETNETINDIVEVIGRCNVTLSAAYNWSIPATSIIINRPIFNTRPLPWNIIWGGYSTPPSIESCYYQIDNNSLKFAIKCNANGISNSAENSIKIPLFPMEAFNGTFEGYAVDNAIATSPLAVLFHPMQGEVISLGRAPVTFSTWQTTGYKSVNIRGSVFI